MSATRFKQRFKAEFKCERACDCEPNPPDYDSVQFPFGWFETWDETPLEVLLIEESQDVSQQ